VRARPTKRFILFRPFMIAALCTVIAGTWFVFGKTGVWASHRLRVQKQAQLAEIEQLEEHKQALQKYLAALRAGDELALEKAARDRGFVAPNETIYSIRIEPDTSR